MTNFLRRVLWPAFALLVALTLITGVLYPAVVTAVAQLDFNHQANGSLIVARDGRTIGSSLIGQAFSDDTYFRGRPSAAGATDANPLGYDASSSGGSNLGPTNQDLIDRIDHSVAAYQAANGNAPIPVDLITTSASGLDPDISPASAEYQVARVAKARSMSEDDVRAAVARHTEQPLLGFLGQPRVHVLELNLDLDGLLQ
ncbi:MAG TPA: potassium-transporting ATPase subunit KdpC [Candidatus Limnocylindrales bacterium]|jgi:K+-transporting ATPase ATPase C chain